MDWSTSDPNNPYPRFDASTSDGRKKIGEYIATTNSAPNWQSGLTRGEYEDIKSHWQQAQQQ
jgi:hypothetical protein